MLRSVLPFSLEELPAIPLGCQRTSTKWLVISPTLSRDCPLLNPLPQASEEANEKSNFVSQRARGQKIRYASFKIRNPS